MWRADCLMRKTWLLVRVRQDQALNDIMGLGILIDLVLQPSSATHSHCHASDLIVTLNVAWQLDYISPDSLTSHSLRWPFHAFMISFKPTVPPPSTFLSANNLASYFTEKMVVIKLELSQTPTPHLLTPTSLPLSLYILGSAALWGQHLHLYPRLYPSYIIN